MSVAFQFPFQVHDQNAVQALLSAIKPGFNQGFKNDMLQALMKVSINGPPL